MAVRRFFSKAYTSYKQAVDDAFNRKNLFYTNVLLSMGISLMGDSIEQRYELFKGDIDHYDIGRTAQMGFSGATAGIICHHWYNFIDRVIVGRTLYMVIKKLMLDQFICSPVIILSFFATVAIFEENPIENFTEEVRDKFLTLYKAEWVVWPPAQIINFYFLPTRFRVLYDNTISLGYDIYTSNVKHDKSYKNKSQPEMQSLTKKWKIPHKTVMKRIIDRLFSDKFLIFTNISISVTLSSVGDSIEQSYEIHTNEMEKYDPKRTMHMGCSGAAVGVLCHHWYKVLDRYIIGRTIDMVAKKIILDQIIFSPIMIMTFFASVALFEDHPYQNFKEEIKDKFLILYRAEWVVWPPAQIINFYFLPTRFRVLYDNIISLGYDIYTSQVKHYSKPKLEIQTN